MSYFSCIRDEITTLKGKILYLLLRSSIYEQFYKSLRLTKKKNVQEKNLAEFKSGFPKVHLFLSIHHMLCYTFCLFVTYSYGVNSESGHCGEVNTEELTFPPLSINSSLV